VNVSHCHVKLSYANHNDERGLAKIIAFSYGGNTVGGGGKCSTSNYLITFFVTIALNSYLVIGKCHTFIKFKTECVIILLWQQKEQGTHKDYQEKH